MQANALEARTIMVPCAGDVLLEAYGGTVILVEFSQIHAFRAMYPEGFEEAFKREIERSLTMAGELLETEGVEAFCGSWSGDYLVAGWRNNGGRSDQDILQIIKPILAETTEIRYAAGSGNQQIILSLLDITIAKLSHNHFLSADSVAQKLLKLMNLARHKKTEDERFWTEYSDFYDTLWDHTVTRETKSSLGADIIRALAQILDNNLLETVSYVLAPPLGQPNPRLRIELAGTSASSPTRSKWSAREVRNLCKRYGQALALDAKVIRHCTQLAQQAHESMIAATGYGYDRAQLPMSLNTLKAIAYEDQRVESILNDLRSLPVPVTIELVDIDGQPPRRLSETECLKQWIDHLKACVPGLNIMTSDRFVEGRPKEPVVVDEVLRQIKGEGEPESMPISLDTNQDPGALPGADRAAQWRAIIRSPRQSMKEAHSQHEANRLTEAWQPHKTALSRQATSQYTTVIDARRRFGKRDTTE